MGEYGFYVKGQVIGMSGSSSGAWLVKGGEATVQAGLYTTKTGHILFRVEREDLGSALTATDITTATGYIIRGGEKPFRFHGSGGYYIYWAMVDDNGVAVVAGANDYLYVEYQRR